MTILSLRNILPAVVSVLILTGALLVPGRSLAQTAQAYVTTNLNQRAGAGTHYPVIVVVPARSPVTIYGCLSDRSWCDGVFQGNRGWFSASYLQVFYQGAYLTVTDYARYAPLPVVAFNINRYWASHYPNYPFYAQLAVYAPGGSVQIGIGSFYRPLAPHGSWVLIRGRYVWVPRVPANWRPYTEGRWVYTRTYGWMWVSSEPFGWATYHYGRWAYSQTFGWFWVPGTRWAPAWVAWRASDDYLAWAPLPPDPQDSFGISISISFGNIPNYYWQAVPAQNFLASNLASVVIGDNNQVTNVINQTQVIGNVNIVNNVVVNNIVNVNFVEEKTQQEVVVYNVALSPDADQSGEVQGDTIEVFHPSTTELPLMEAPPEVTPVEQVAQESQTAGQSGDEPATDDLVPPPPLPDEAPPLPTEAPPMVGEERPVEEAPAATEGAPPAAPEVPAEEEAAPPPPVPETAPLPAEEPALCPEGTPRQEDGTCAPPAEPPLAPTMEQPAEQPAFEPPPPELAPPPPPEPEQPTAEPAPPPPPPPPAAEEPPPQQAPTCPEGYVLGEEGVCLLPEQ